jgi:tetratricopeptide (TPR) repeat protein
METNDDINYIGEELGVKTVLQGSVRISGDRVRIAAQLTDISDGSYMWTENYDRMLTDIFAVQEEVAAAIIGALQIHVVEVPTRKQPTENSEAYVLFLRARVLLDAQQGREAISLLLQATALDPNFAEANELLAYSYWQQGGTSIPAAESQRLANEAAAKTLAINPDLTFAQALFQLSATENRADWRALELLERAWREQPNSSERLRLLFYELTARGYVSDAHRIALQFVELQPLSTVAHYSLGESLVALGKTNEALPSLQLALELDNAFASWFVPMFYLAVGRDESAIAHYEAELERAGISDSSWVRDLVTAARDPVSGKAYLDSHIPRVLASLPEEYVFEWQDWLSLWYLAFGFIDHKYENIFAAGPNRKIWSAAEVDVWLGTIFRRVGFTADPRYLEVAELLGIVDVWEQRGPPDFCEKLDGEWVCE